MGPGISWHNGNTDSHGCDGWARIGLRAEGYRSVSIRLDPRTSVCSPALRLHLPVMLLIRVLTSAGFNDIL